MRLQCPKCHEMCETEAEIAPGRRMRCPFCNEKFIYESHMSSTPGKTCLTACPQCGNVFGVDEMFIGSRQKCVECGREFEIWKYKEIEEPPHPPPVAAFQPQQPPQNEMRSAVAEAQAASPEKKVLDIPGMSSASRGSGVICPIPAKVVPVVTPLPKPEKKEEKHESWSMYSAAAVAAALAEARSDDADTRTKTNPGKKPKKTFKAKPPAKSQASASGGDGVAAWRRRFSYVRAHLSHWILGIAFLFGSAFGLNYLYKQISAMSPSTKDEVEPILAGEMQHGLENPAPDGEIKDAMEKNRLIDEYKTAKKRFFAECGVIDDIDAFLVENKEFWCIFDKHKERNVIYHATAEKGRLKMVEAMNKDGNPFERQDAAAFKKRLTEQPSVLAAPNGDLRLYPMGKYPVPPRGGGFCLKTANISTFYWGWGVNLNAQGNTGTKYKVSLLSRSAQGTRIIAVSEGVGYVENIEWRHIAAKLAVELGLGSINDPAVERELRDCQLVIGDTLSDYGVSSASLGPMPKPAPGVTPPQNKQTRQLTPSGNDFVVAPNPFDSYGDNTVDVDMPSRTSKGNSSRSADNRNSSGRQGGGKAAADAPEKRTLSGLMLSIDNPKVEQRVSDNDDGFYDNYWTYGTKRKVSNRIYTYKGKLSGSAPPGVRIPVRVEAMFVTCPYEGGSAREQIKQTTIVLDDVLGSKADGAPTSHKLDFKSPEIREVETKEHRWTYGGRRYGSTTTGEHYCGVILRLWVDGRIKSVKTMPSNRKWEKAAMASENVILD